MDTAINTVHILSFSHSVALPLSSFLKYVYVVADKMLTVVLFHGKLTWRCAMHCDFYIDWELHD